MAENTRKSLKTIIEESEPYLRKKVKWYNKKAKKSQNNPNPKDIWLAYVDARALEDYLDDSVGPENWQTCYKDIKGQLFCEVGINCNGQWIWKGNNGTTSNIEAEKGEASDAFKRACFKWGFGRFLYDDKRKPVKGRNSFDPKDQAKEELEKSQIAVEIMEYDTKLPLQVEEALNYVSSKGNSSLNDCNLATLKAILDRLKAIEADKEKQLTAGFEAPTT